MKINSASKYLSLVFNASLLIALIVNACNFYNESHKEIAHYNVPTKLCRLMEIHDPIRQNGEMMSGVTVYQCPEGVTFYKNDELY